MFFKRYEINKKNKESLVLTSRMRSSLNRRVERNNERYSLFEEFSTDLAKEEDKVLNFKIDFASRMRSSRAALLRKIKLIPVRVRKSLYLLYSGFYPFACPVYFLDFLYCHYRCIYIRYISCFCS